MRDHPFTLEPTNPADCPYCARIMREGGQFCPLCKHYSQEMTEEHDLSTGGAICVMCWRAIQFLRNPEGRLE